MSVQHWAINQRSKTQEKRVQRRNFGLLQLSWLGTEITRLPRRLQPKANILLDAAGTSAEATCRHRRSFILSVPWVISSRAVPSAIANYFFGRCRPWRG